MPKKNKKNKKTTQKHVYTGNKNKTDYPEFIKLCMMSQKMLKRHVTEKLVDEGYEDVVTGDGYVYAKGNIPVLVTAHLDTVHKERVSTFYEDKSELVHKISSPQGIGGDDRCGVYGILEIIKEYKPYVLFCEDEEIGGVGSTKFTETEMITELENVNFMIELDRANGKDAVFYDCDNPEFTEFIKDATGYEEAYGSFSDISTLAPVVGVAAVNLSCGYYKAHTKEEYVIMEELLNTIEKVKTLLSVETSKFEYIESAYSYGGYGYLGKGALYDYNYGYGYGYYDSSDKGTHVEYTAYITYTDKNGILREDLAYGFTKDEALVDFFIANPTVCYNDIDSVDWDYYYF